MNLAFDNEKEIQLKSFIGALVISLLLLAALFLISLTQPAAPNPPPIEFIEVNFGTMDRGSGKIQTYNKPSDSPNPADVKPSDERPKRDVAPSKVNTTPRLERTRATPTPTVADAKPAKTPTEKPDIVSKVASPVTVAERPEPKRTVTAKSAPAAERPAPPVEAKKEALVNNDALFKKSSGGGGSNGTVGKASGTGGNNNGDDASGVGDKGNPNGKIDAKEFYGTPGGSKTGVAFDVSGWSMASRPNVNDDSDETGKIVFLITVDSSGDIISVKTRQTTVSPVVVDQYRKAVQRLKLRPKGGATPPTATGTITFIITSK